VHGICLFFLMAHAEFDRFYKKAYRNIEFLCDYALRSLKTCQTCVLIPTKKGFSCEVFFKVEHTLSQTNILMCPMLQPRPTVTCIQANIGI